MDRAIKRASRPVIARRIRECIFRDETPRPFEMLLLRIAAAVIYRGQPERLMIKLQKSGHRGAGRGGGGRERERERKDE